MQEDAPISTSIIYLLCHQPDIFYLVRFHKRGTLFLADGSIYQILLSYPWSLGGIYLMHNLTGGHKLWAEPRLCGHLSEYITHESGYCHCGPSPRFYLPDPQFTGFRPHHNFPSFAVSWSYKSCTAFPGYGLVGNLSVLSVVGLLVWLSSMLPCAFTSRLAKGRKKSHLMYNWFVIYLSLEL